MKKCSDDDHFCHVERLDGLETGPEVVEPCDFEDEKIEIAREGFVFVVPKLGADHHTANQDRDEVVAPNGDSDTVLAAKEIVLFLVLGCAVDPVEEFEGVGEDLGRPCIVDGVPIPQIA